MAQSQPTSKVSSSKFQVPVSRAEAEAVVKEGARLQATLGAAVALRDADVLAAQNKHATVIAQLSAEIVAAKAAVETWAKENKAAEFGERQSLDLPFAVLKFNRGKPALELRAGWDWKDVVKGLVGKFKCYGKRKVDPDKAAILKDATCEEPKLTTEDLVQLGVKVVREESFDVVFRACPETLKARDEV